ncbi:KinB-signaling pathway activation protein [Alicyclobacillus macrosporangiidus]|uniref:KinB-signaling pathway activation protein n=1 Tax=Alicyclobacillus macrosporangiidus TaxID=392015 RepID=UPI0004953C9E|nr:KinB-signaling pathway activation protein [Alicyclobacillus macrosporangiidus]
MRLNRLMFLIATTVLLGAGAGILTTATGWWLHVPWFAGMVSGAFFATTSLMGFWAYLTLNFVARVTLPRRVWRWAQALVLAIVLYDMLYWRYHLHAASAGEDPALFWTSFWQGLWPLAPALAGAFAKQRLSGKGSFLPALFFLYVFTILDSLPFIWLQYGWSQSSSLVNQTLLVVMACNLYLILVFGKLLNRPEGAGSSVMAEPMETGRDGTS